MCRAALKQACLQPFSLFIATKIQQKWKGFQAHFKQIQDQSWLDIFNFTLLLFMWFVKKTGQLSQLHCHVHVTGNVSKHSHIPSQLLSLQHFSLLMRETVFFYSCKRNCSFFYIILVRHIFLLTYWTEIPPISSYLYCPLYPLCRTLAVTLSRRYKHLQAFGTCGL